MAQEPKRLPDLPSSESEFWDGEVSLKDVRNRYRSQMCKHNFDVFDREIRCNRCGMGFFISVDDEIRDGHLYSDNKFVI